MRKRFQSGTIVEEGDKVKKYKLRYVSYEIDENGHEVRKRRKVELGLVSEIGTERAARRAAQPLLAEINANAGRPKHLITFAAVCKKWTEMILRQHKPSSQNGEKVHLRKLVEAFGQVPVAELNREKIQRWVSEQTCSAKYTRNIVATFRLVWEESQNWGYIDEDKRSPFEKLKTPKRGLINKPCFTPEQVREVIRKADEPYRTMYWIVAETGMRGGEVCGLFVEDVDLVNCLVHVRRSAWQGTLQTPKTGNAVRSFPISRNLVEHIRGYISGSAPTKLLFRTQSGHPYNNGNLVSQKLRPLLESMGIYQHKLGLHGFRRASASAMDGLMTPMKVRQERLGHGSAEMTMGYTSANSQDHHIVAEALGKMFDPSSAGGVEGHATMGQPTQMQRKRVIPQTSGERLSSTLSANRELQAGIKPSLADSPVLDLSTTVPELSTPVRKPNSPTPPPEWTRAQGAD